MKYINRFCILLFLSLLLFSLLAPAVAVSGQTAQAMPPHRAPSVSSISVPTYTHGTASSWMIYDGGQATTWQDEPYESKMQIICNTNATEYLNYCKGLLSKGYTRLYSKVVEGKTDKNRYLRYLSPNEDYIIYAYYTAASQQVRLIVDTHPDTLQRFSYSGTGTKETQVYMYALSNPDDCYAAGTDPNTTQRRNEAGSMYIIRMPDNSLFIVDGGGLEQMGDRDAEKLYRFCRKITGVPEGERMIINTWFISHGHADHYAGFPRFISIYNDSFLLKNIMYNFEVLNTSRSYTRIVSKLYPEAKFYKPHTGDSFTIAGVQFDVLYTTEDRYKPNSSNKLLLNDSSCTDYPNENNTSTVLRVTFDGKKLLLTGDLQKADALLLGMYPAADLKSDLLQIPHHGADYHVDLVKTVAPTISFINQVETARARLNVYANHASWKAYCGQLYWSGTETVGYSASKGIFYREAFTPNDYLGWSSATYPVQKENPYTSPAVTASEEYYRYSKVSALTTSDQAYVIADKKLDRIFAYDANTGTVSSNYAGLFNNGKYYFSASQRRLVNWLIRYTTFQTHASAAVDGVKTYYGGTPIQKGTGDYWGTPTLPTGMVLGKNDTFTATGMYGTWAKGSDQFESLATGTWVDALKDGSFLIYRHYKGTYYPFYRDASVATDGGWGVTELTKAQTNAKLDYLQTCLYAYEATPSKMRLSWTGHKDYTITAGPSPADLISLVAGDLRVNYSLDDFGAKGEIPYDAYGIQKVGTYWLECSPAYDPQRVGDYTLTIRYKNPNEVIQDLGSVTVHAKAPVDTDKLYFTFDNLPADQERYQEEAAYSGFNFDGTSRWEYSRNGKIPGTVNTADEGTVKLTISDWDANTLKGTNLSPYAGDTAPLKYNPKHAQVMQIRFKMNNMRAAVNSDPFIRLWYTKTENGQAVTTYDRAYNLGTNYVSDGQYITATIDLFTQADITANASVSGFPTTTFANAGTISDITVAFHNFAANATESPGEIIVDYIYIGPKAQMPKVVYTATFCNEDGQVLQTGRVCRGETASYTGAVPTKAADEVNHYTFAGWKTKEGAEAVLTEISSDLTVYASYMSTAHSYSYEALADGTLKATCSCGYEEVREPVEDGTLKLNHSLNLASDISLNLQIPKTLLEGFDMTTVYVESTIDTYDGNEKTGTTTIRTDPVESGYYYYFTTDGLTAVQMNDKISSVIYGTKEGYPYYSPVDEYSIATYAYSQLDKATVADSLKTLCADLLRYGTQAQIFKAYRTDSLADSLMTEAHKAYLSDMEAVTFGNTNRVLNDLSDAPITWAGKALNLESKVALKFIFNPASYTGSPSDLTLRISYEDAQGSIKTLILDDPELYAEGMRVYVFTLDTLLAAELRAVVSAQIFAGETPVSCTLEYSADTYGNNKTGPLLHLCKALFAYSDSAKAYFAK